MVGGYIYPQNVSESSEIDPYKYSEIVFDEGVISNGKNLVMSRNGAETTEYLHIK